MRFKTLIILVLISMGSCKSDDDQSSKQKENIDLLIGDWDLFNIINNSVGGETSPTDDDTHSYTFNNDNTFIRVSKKDTQVFELKGKYIVSETNEIYKNQNRTIEKFVELTYDDTNIRFFNCGIIDENKQLLFFTSSNILRNTQEGACDGNTFEYKKE